VTCGAGKRATLPSGGIAGRERPTDRSRPEIPSDTMPATVAENAACAVAETAAETVQFAAASVATRLAHR
jgi:hypothetical protein